VSLIKKNYPTITYLLAERIMFHKCILPGTLILYAFDRTHKLYDPDWWEFGDVKL
jgi:hypothetical protein